MNLSPELEQYIADKVASGMYPTGNDVVREALQALEQKEDYRASLAELRREIDKGLTDLAAGRTVPLTAELIESIKERGRARHAEKSKNGKVGHA